MKKLCQVGSNGLMPMPPEKLLSTNLPAREAPRGKPQGFLAKEGKNRPVRHSPDSPRGRDYGGLCAPIKRKVAILIDRNNSYNNNFLSGVAAYIREHTPWFVCIFTRGLRESEKIGFSEWHGQGIIVCLDDKVIHRTVSRLKIPMVCIGDAEYMPSWPRVKTDHAAVARMAAEHLLERGFKQFGFCGHESWLWSIPRQEHFERLIRDRGFPCSVFNPARQVGAEDAETEAIGRWLAGLSKPAGIMTSEDFHGRMVLDACRQSGILVPDEIAVIGASEEHDSICELSNPPLSCVILKACCDGYEAAAMLDALMSGKKLEQKVRLVGPVGIKTRQSTDVLAIEDRNIAFAVRYIRENACNGINVRDVLKAVPQSRSVLEYHFQKLIGRTPHDEIIRVKLNHVKTLLSESDLSLEQIAEKSGFEHVAYFSDVFHKQTGMPPSHYRALHRSSTRVSFAADSSH